MKVFWTATVIQTRSVEESVVAFWAERGRKEETGMISFECNSSRVVIKYVLFRNTLDLLLIKLVCLKLHGELFMMLLMMGAYAPPKSQPYNIYHLMLFGTFWMSLAQRSKYSSIKLCRDWALHTSHAMISWPKMFYEKSTYSNNGQCHNALGVCNLFMCIYFRYDLLDYADLKLNRFPVLWSYFKCDILKHSIY